MSSETRQYVEEVVALSPWVAFIIAMAWFWVLELRDDARASRAHARARPGQSDSGSTTSRARLPNSRARLPLAASSEGPLHSWQTSTVGIGAGATLAALLLGFGSLIVVRRGRKRFTNA